MLKLLSVMLVAVLLSAVVAWLESVSGSLGQLVEQNFVVLTLALLVPLAAPWLE